MGLGEWRFRASVTPITEFSTDRIAPTTGRSRLHTLSGSNSPIPDTHVPRQSRLMHRKYERPPFAVFPRLAPGIDSLACNYLPPSQYLGGHAADR